MSVDFSSEQVPEDARIIDDALQANVRPPLGAGAQIHDDVLTAFDALEGLQERGHRINHVAQAIGREHDDGDAQPRETLLMIDRLIGGDQDVKTGIGLTQEDAILEAGPATIGHRRGLVRSGEESLELPRQTLIDQDAHASGSGTLDEHVSLTQRFHGLLARHGRIRRKDLSQADAVG